MDVKSLIITKVEEKEEQKVQKTTKPKAAVEYSIALADNCDLAIVRKTSRTEQMLVMIISQFLNPKTTSFYIKDMKTGNIDELDIHTESKYLPKLKKFFQDLQEPLDTGLAWWPTINRFDISYERFGMLDRENMVKMAKDGIPIFNLAGWTYNELISFYGSNRNIFLYAYKNMSLDKMNSSKFFRFIKNFNLTNDDAKYFIDKLMISPVSNFDVYSGYTLLIQHCKIRRLIDYLLFDIYYQGYYSIAGALSSLEDFYRCQLALYGKVKEKYPKYLATEHNIAVFKYNLVREQIESKDFEDFVNSEEYTNLNYDVQGQRYCIITPKLPSDLADEGTNLNHCVKTYISKVAKQESKILFLRERKARENSLVTIEVKNNTVIQVKGMRNRQPNTEEMKFVNLWADKNNLTVSQYV